MYDCRVNITSLTLAEIAFLGEDLKSDWHVERELKANGEYTCWLIKGEGVRVSQEEIDAII
jgi:hypothetical protein